MTRRCSHCSNNGHNSRTCPTRANTTATCTGGGGVKLGGGGVKLFGVRLTDGSIMKKSASMGNLLYHSSPSPSPSSLSPVAVSPNLSSSPATSDHGYLSDDPVHALCSAKRRADRKKGTPWTEEEHRLFLLGLQKLGKGDWRGIARNYVLSRTPTQVASHAQKYFIRQCSATRRKRRSSLFDMAPDTSVESAEDHFMLPPAAGSDHSDNSHCSLKLSLKPDSDQSMEPAPNEIKQDVKEETSTPKNDLPPIIPTYYHAYVPIPFPVWPSTMTLFDESTSTNNNPRVLKPIPVHSKQPMNVDELVGMSKQLSLKDPENPLSLKLRTEPSRQSAFHSSNQVVGGSGLKKCSGNGF